MPNNEVALSEVLKEITTVAYTQIPKEYWLKINAEELWHMLISLNTFLEDHAEDHMEMVEEDGKMHQEMTESMKGIINKLKDFRALEISQYGGGQ